MTRHRMLLGVIVGVGVLAAPGGAQGQINPGRDRRNDNDRQQRQRHDEREFLRALAFYHLVGNYMMAQQTAAYYLPAAPARYMPPVYQRYVRQPAARASGNGYGKTNSEPSAVFREAAGERELELGRLWAEKDPATARSFLEKAVQRAAAGSAIAEAARKELEALADR